MAAAKKEIVSVLASKNSTVERDTGMPVIRLSERDSIMFENDCEYSKEPNSFVQEMMNQYYGKK